MIDIGETLTHEFNRDGIRGKDTRFTTVQVHLVDSTLSLNTWHMMVNDYSSGTRPLIRSCINREVGEWN